MWRLIVNKSTEITDKEITAFYQSFPSIPMKGTGGIQVASKDIIKAHKVLKAFVGYDEYQYCPKDFITSDDSLQYNYYGKFDIDNFPNLLFELIDNDIQIINVEFFD